LTHCIIIGRPQMLEHNPAHWECCPSEMIGLKTSMG
jgi:hypothetical protein